MWDSWKDLLLRNPARRFSDALLKAGLCQLLLALDYLHTECHLVHTGKTARSRTILTLIPFLTISKDLKADNVLQELVDQGVLDAFTKAELETPSARKSVGGATVYTSRRFGLPEEFGDVVLGDFGAAVRGDVKRNHDAQPYVYRSPEVMLKTEWSYPVDIWNVGAMVSPIPTPKMMPIIVTELATDLGPLRGQTSLLWVRHREGQIHHASPPRRGGRHARAAALGPSQQR